STSQRRLRASRLIVAAKSVSPAASTPLHADSSRAARRSTMPGVNRSVTAATASAAAADTSPLSSTVRENPAGMSSKRAVLPAWACSSARAHAAPRRRWFTAAAAAGLRICNSGPGPEAAMRLSRKKNPGRARDFHKCRESPALLYSGGLLYSRNQPARAAVDRLLQVPDLAERFRLAVLLAYQAAEAHAHDVEIALGGDVHHFRVEGHDFRLLRRAPLRAQVGFDLAIHLRREEVAHGRKVALVVRRLHVDEIDLRLARERDGIEAGGPGGCHGRCVYPAGGRSDGLPAGAAGQRSGRGHLSRRTRARILQ